jgi:hypothetical protein
MKVLKKGKRSLAKDRMSGLNGLSREKYRQMVFVIIMKGNN